jgi:hypothetical protein
VEKITAWKGGKDVIKTSLCKLGDKELVGEAIQAYRNMTGFMGDRPTSKPGNAHALKLLNSAMNSTDGLHNEVCQRKPPLRAESFRERRNLCGTRVS